jgi:hypothetical protein
LRDPKAFYDQGGTSVKRAMNKLVFTKLYVDGEKISDHELGDAVRDVIQAERRLFRKAARHRRSPWRAPLASQSLETPVAPSGKTGPSGTHLLVAAHSGHGSSRTVLVAGTG